MRRQGIRLRDMETLALSNIAIYAIHGAGGGYGTLKVVAPPSYAEAFRQFLGDMIRLYR
ncbi:hypothetical protein [Cohnella sp. 56]|uniref:hypothetical protein n=1 Tax=Cohnella sp. 56 TaxID=3113722 RepID=UPI0030E8673C